MEKVKERLEDAEEQVRRGDNLYQMRALQVEAEQIESPPSAPRATKQHRLCLAADMDFAWPPSDNVVQLVRDAQPGDLIIYAACSAKRARRRRSTATPPPPIFLFGLPVERRDPARKPSSYVCHHTVKCQICRLMPDKETTRLVRRFQLCFIRGPSLARIIQPPSYAPRLAPGTGIVIEVPEGMRLTLIFASCEACVYGKQADVDETIETRSLDDVSTRWYTLSDTPGGYVGRGSFFQDVPDLVVTLNTTGAPVSIMLYNPADAPHVAVIDTLICSRDDFTTTMVTDNDRFDVLTGYSPADDPIDIDPVDATGGDYFDPFTSEAQIPDAPDLSSSSSSSSSEAKITSLANSSVNNFWKDAASLGIDSSSTLWKPRAVIPSRPSLPDFFFGELRDEALFIFCSAVPNLPCMARINSFTGLLQVSHGAHETFECQVNRDDRHLNLVTLRKTEPDLTRDSYNDYQLSADESAQLFAESNLRYSFARSELEAIAF